MSEKVYAWLVRLYPAEFRKAYGEEALQLFLDRSRDERGFFPRLRLWFDLLADLVVSIPGQYSRAERALERFEGVPSFEVLESERLRPRALLSAALLSLVTIGSLPALIARGGAGPGGLQSGP